MKDKIRFEDESKAEQRWEKFLDFIHYWSLSRFIDEWVYPGHYLHNLLFHRYDRVKIPFLKPYQWCDRSEMFFYCSFEILKQYVEQEKPFECVDFYEKDHTPTTVTGKIVGDEIKFLYNWYTKTLPETEKEHRLMLDYWCENLCGVMVFKKEDQNDHLGKIEFDRSENPKEFKDFAVSDEQKTVLNKWFDSEEDMMDEDTVCNKRIEKEKELAKEKQDMLHRLVDIREYLWT